MFFFQKYHFESTWPQWCSKFFINNYEAPWLTTALERHPATEDFMDIGVKPAPRHFTCYCICFSFSQTSLVFEFSLMLIKQFLPQFIYLSIFWYCILKFIQYLHAFFIRASKCFSFVKVYSYKMLLYFLFSMKH